MNDTKEISVDVLLCSKCKGRMIDISTMLDKEPKIVCVQPNCENYFGGLEIKPERMEQ